GDGRKWRLATASEQDRREERLAFLGLVLEREHVLAHPAVRTETPMHLLAARPGRLALGALAARAAGVLLELVGAVEVGRVGRRVDPRPDAEAVDRGAGADEIADGVLVQVAAREDGRLAEAAAIEDRTHRPCMGVQVPAVEAHARD